MPDKKEPDDLVKKIDQQIEAMKADHTAINASLKEMTEKTGSDVKSAVEKAEALAKKIEAHSNSILELEQKLGDNVIAGKQAPETLGQSVIKSEAYKQFASGQIGKARIEANTITGISGSPAENSDILVAPDRLAGIVPGAFRMLRVSDVIPQGTTNSNAIDYTRELAFTNNAAETAESAQKPESALTFELVTANVRTIATFLKATRQVIEDAPALEAYIDRRLRYAVEFKWDSQLLNGNGTAPNISGILDSGNHTVYVPNGGANALDAVNEAIYNVYESDYSPSAIIMNPANWGAIERTHVGTSDDRYVIGQPSSALAPRLWGLPVVVTNAISVGTFAVGAFDVSHMAFTRTGTVVEMFEQDEDNVQTNLVTIRSEKRGCLATFLPAAVQAGLIVASGTT